MDGRSQRAREMVSALEPCPIDRGTARELLAAIQTHVLDDPDLVNSYSALIGWHADAATVSCEAIRSLRLELLLDRPESLVVAPRMASDETLLRSVARESARPRSLLRGIASVWVEADMALDEQDALAGIIASALDIPRKRIRDTRSDPTQPPPNVRLALRGAGKRGAEVAIEVRTREQVAWARLWDSLVDALARTADGPDGGHARVVGEAVDVIVAATSEALTRAEEARVSARVWRGDIPDADQTALEEQWAAARDDYERCLLIANRQLTERHPVLGD